MLFTERPFLERFHAAAQAGFAGVECQFPYVHEPAELRRALDGCGLPLVLHNLPAGDWEAGDRGIACDPSRRSEFRQGLERAIEYAEVLDCRQLNCLAGCPPPGVSANEARATFVANLRLAARRLRQHGIRLLVEPINSRDVPGFFLTGSTQARALHDEVDADNLYLQYDVYHMQVMEGDLSRTLERHLDWIGHVQIADVPDRHEPGTGEINYPHVFGLLERLGYRGWFGCEYRPAGNTEDGLAWLPR